MFYSWWASLYTPLASALPLQLPCPTHAFPVRRGAPTLTPTLVFDDSGMQDLDTVLLRDPYAELKRAPLARFNWIYLPDMGNMPANGGLWYAQNAQVGAGVQWMVSEVARRTAQAQPCEMPSTARRGR